MKDLTDEQILTSIKNALIDRNFYNPYDVFNHAPEIERLPIGEKYHYKVSIYKWNTASTRVTKLGARWDDKKGKFILSTYKQGSISRQKHGEKMR